MSFKKPKFEIAQLFREHRHRLKFVSNHVEKVTDAIVACRTAELGGHVYKCNDFECENEVQAYNSCRNRNCPKCQHSAKELWVEKRVSELLPVPYYHMVFTIPHIFNELILHNRKQIYDLLLKVSQESVKDLFKTRYKATPGIISLLHTWGSNMSLHVHAHMLVTGGGIHFDGESWIRAKENYCLPVKALSPVFRAKFIKGLRKLNRKNKLKLPPALQEPFAFENLLDSSFKKKWVVYAKKPFTAPIHVLNYLGNYTHRIAFANHRIVDIKNDQVIFKYKDYKSEGNEKKVMSLQIPEFLRRFRMHIVPKNFVKIRSYGFMANRFRVKNIERVRELIDKSSSSKKQKLDKIALEKIIEDFKKDNAVDMDLCQKCKRGRMQKLKEIPAIKKGEVSPYNTS